MPSITVESPIGPLLVVEEDDAIVALHIGRHGREENEPTPLLRDAAQQLDAYFARRRRRFELPVAPRGSGFQRALWRLLEAIPYGEVRTYGALAADLGAVPRAIGGACGSNPIPVIIPCHRVIASDQSLGGFSGGDGLPTKRRLLELEGAEIAVDLFTARP